MNYTTMSGQEFMQRYPQGLQGYENITPQEFMREFPTNNYDTITPEEFLREFPAKDYETITAQEYLQKYAPPETITPEEYFRRYPNSGRLKGFEKPLLEAGRIGGRVARGAGSKVARGLGYFIPGVGAALTAADIYDGLNSPVGAADNNTEQSYTLENYVPEYVEPLKGNDGNYILQGGLTHNYILPPATQANNFNK